MNSMLAYYNNFGWSDFAIVLGVLTLLEVALVILFWRSK